MGLFEPLRWLLSPQIRESSFVERSLRRSQELCAKLPPGKLDFEIEGCGVLGRWRSHLDPELPAVLRPQVPLPCRCPLALSPGRGAVGFLAHVCLPCSEPSAAPHCLQPFTQIEGQVPMGLGLRDKQIPVNIDVYLPGKLFTLTSSSKFECVIQSHGLKST